MLESNQLTVLNLLIHSPVSDLQDRYEKLQWSAVVCDPCLALLHS